MKNITDSGLSCIGTALITNSTLKVLMLSGDLSWVSSNATDKLVPLLKALQTNQSLESLSIHWLSTHPDQSLKKMRESVAKSSSSLKQLNMTIVSPRLLTEETIKDWTQSVQFGATDLIQSLGCHQLQHLSLNIICAYSIDSVVDKVMNIQ